ncbi:hypothetical protein ACO0SA_000691 [Hanseniaspora valbyensis]
MNTDFNNNTSSSSPSQGYFEGQQNDLSNHEPQFIHNDSNRQNSNGDSSSQLEMMNMFLAGDLQSTISTTDTAVDSNAYQQDNMNTIPAKPTFGQHKKTQSMNNVQELMTQRVSPKYANNIANVRPGLKSHKSTMSMTSITNSSTTTNTNTIDNNKILPKTNFNSPFYIAVPTPKGTNANAEVFSKQGKNANATITTTMTTSNKTPLNTHFPSHSISNLIPDAEKLGYGDFIDGNTTLTTTSSSNEYPTTIIVDRFIKWKKILKALISYYREVAMAQEQFARINNNIKSSMKFGTILPNILDNGTIVSGETSTTTTATKTTTIKPPLNKSNSEFTMTNSSQQDDFAFPSRPRLGSRTTSTSSCNSNQSDDEYVNNSPSSITTTTINTGDYLPFGSGSIQDLQVILKKHHISLAKKQYDTSKELETKLIPKLEDLKKDLTFKIKEIKSLHEDFKTNIKEHVAITGQLLQKFMLSLEFIENSNSNSANTNLFDLMDSSNKNLKAKNDPYLLKLQLDLQLKRQLLEEHYLQDSYTNLQKNGLELEKIIYLNIQKSLSKYSNLIDCQVRLTLQTLCNDLNQGILNKPPAVEWDNFVVNHPTSLLNWKSNDPFPVYRKLSDIKYPHLKSALAKCVRAGYLLKKNRLKKYTRSYFILTSNYLHEFKSSDFFKSNSSNNDDAIVNKNAKSLLTPIMSINLNHAYLAESSDEKMVIKLKNGAVEVTIDQDPEINALSQKSKASSYGSKGNTENLQQSASSVSKKIGKLWKKPHSSENSSSALKIPTSSSSPLTEKSTSYSESTFSFRYDSSDDISEQEAKNLFKKWVQDIKQLCSYETSRDRAKYIHEKVVNLKLEHAQRNNQLKNKNANLTTGNSKNTKISNKLGKPSHIELPNHSKKFVVPASMGNVVMTPSIDDNGNLVTVNEPRIIDNNVSSINSNGETKTTNNFDNDNGPVKTLLSNENIASSPGGDSLGKLSNDSLKLVTSPKENTPSQTTTMNNKNSAGSSPAVVQPVATTSNYNASGGGGYFGIPINRTTSNTSMTSKSKTVQSPASMARQIMAKPSSPQPQKPMLVRSSSSTNSLTTAKKTAPPGAANAFLSHKRISSLTSISSLTNKVGPKASKLYQMPEESDFEASDETANNTVDFNKSLYD